MKQKEYVKITHIRYRDSSIHINSLNELFLKDLIMKITDEFISFSRPNLDYRGTLNHLRRVKNTSFYGTTVAQKLTEGTYYFDCEESDEDCLIAYF